MKKLIFPIILVLVVALLIYFNFRSADKNENVFSKQRTFDLNFKQLSCFPIEFTPAFAKIQNNHINVLNFNNQRIYKMDFHGNILDSLGNGKGDGPKENNHIYAYDINGDHYFTFDVVKQSINKVGFDNELMEYYTDSLRIENIIHITGNEFLATYMNNDQSLSFRVLDIGDRSNKKLSKADGIFPKVPHAYWVYEGRFFKNKNSDLIYLTFYSNDLLRFARNGSLVYHKKLIHKTPLIKIKEEGDLIIPSANNTPSVLDAGVGEDFIYVLSNISDKSNPKNKEKRVLDVYRLENGKYYTSLVLPNDNETPPMDIAVGNHKLMLVYETKICVYKIEFE